MPNVDFNWFWSYGESRQDLIKRYRHIEVQSKMPVNVHYSNSLYGVAGEAAARVAGESYEHVVRNKVLRPLGLTSTGFSMPELISTSNFAIPYKARSYADAKAGRFDELPLDDDLPNDVAAGDIYSSALDLARWGQIVMKGGVQNGKQVLSKEGIAATLTAHTIGYGIIRDPDFGLSDQYGMGWGLSSYKGNNIYEHSGRTFGYMANLVMFPNAELVVAQVSNSDLTALLRFSAYHIADQVLGLRKSHDWLNNGTVATESYFVSETKTEEGIYPERIPNKPPTHELSAYAGKYDHPGFGTATIRLEGGKLHISFAAFRGVLAHYHYDSFTTVFEHVSVKLGELISFSTGADGRVSGVSFALFDTVINAKKEWN
ncbi:hypothetical protein BG003_004589 [Podila horticola]|nr:hypothetical protein BG003_004589 [Podila horticola]